MAVREIFTSAVEWSNQNQGIVSLLIFAATIAFGWGSGIFSALRRRPRFRIKVIDGPTFACTFEIGTKHEEWDVHRTGIALYLHVTNSGSAGASIEEVHVAYHWSVYTLSKLWWRYVVGWYWITSQSTAMEDFQHAIGENVKIYPFLFQRSSISGHSGETYLETGRSTSGVVYFEQNDSYGGCFPAVKNDQVAVKIRIIDAFGGSHVTRQRIPWVTLSDARKYNPSFGQTFAQLRQQPLPFDLESERATAAGSEATDT